jgi:hypothetical protein
MAKQTKESEFQKSLRKTLSSYGVATVKMGVVDTNFCLPDLLSMVRKDKHNAYPKCPKSFFIEVKRETGSLQDIQKAANNFLDKYIDVFLITNQNELDNFIASYLL